MEKIIKQKEIEILQIELKIKKLELEILNKYFNLIYFIRIERGFCFYRFYKFLNVVY